MSNTVLLVGATSDMARALAHAYAARGRPLVLAAREPARLARDAEDLRLRYGVPVTTLALDVLETAAHAAALDSLPELPATVVMLAGMLGEQATSSADPATAERVMRTTYVGPSLFLDRVAERMAARGTGTIVGISSVAGERGRASNYTYGSAKAGFTAYLSGLRNRLAPAGVRVLTVKPGFVRTRMTEGMKLPGALTAEPEEVARAILAAEAKRRETIYVRPVWWLVMAVIRLIPERIFKRLKL